MSAPLLTLESLLVLDAIESRGSFAAAAEQLNKVPSALSYIVQKLEEQLSVTLFVRQGRKSVLTPAGLHLLKEGRKLLGAVNNIAEQTQTIAHGWEPKIRLVFDSIADSKPIFLGLAEFLAHHPLVEIDVGEEVMNGTWEALIKDEADLVIGAPAPIPAHQGIRAIAVGKLDNVLVVSPSHALAQLVKDNSLQNKPVINKQVVSQYRTVVVHDSAKTEIPWSANLISDSSHFYVSTVEQKISAVVAGIGVAFLPKNRIANHLKSGDLLMLDYQDDIYTNELYLAWKIVNKGKGLERLRDILTQYFTIKSL